jgi:hypothetical protein
MGVRVGDGVNHNYIYDPCANVLRASHNTDRRRRGYTVKNGHIIFNGAKETQNTYSLGHKAGPQWELSKKEGGYISHLRRSPSSDTASVQLSG